MYGKWLCRGKCIDCCCVEVSVLILVVLRLVYEYWLCGGKCKDIGCAVVSA